MKLLPSQHKFSVHHIIMPLSAVTYIRCLAVTCHLHFGQNDRNLLHATVVTKGWNRYRNMSQHRKLTLEKKILPPLLQGFEPMTFWSWVQHSNHWVIPTPEWPSSDWRWCILSLICHLWTLIPHHWRLCHCNLSKSHTQWSVTSDLHLQPSSTSESVLGNLLVYYQYHYQSTSCVPQPVYIVISWITLFTAWCT